VLYTMLYYEITNWCRLKLVIDWLKQKYQVVYFTFL